MSQYREFVNKLEKSISRSKVGLDIAFRMRKFANAVIGKSFYVDQKMHDTGEVNALKVLAPHITTFMDVGANVGEWTNYLLSFANKNITGFLYEPSKSAMEKLKDQFGGDDRLMLSSAALGDKCGFSTFHEEPDAGQTASILEGISGTDAVKVQVPLTTLENEFDKYKITSVDLVKIDTEGYDGRILKSAKNLIAEQRIGIIQFEYNSSWINARCTLAEALNLLDDHGYATYLLRPHKACEYDYLTYNEFFFYANFIAVSPGMKEICRPLLVNENRVCS